MATTLERMQEIERRGLQDKLPPEKRAIFDEAMRRGLVKPSQPQEPRTFAQDLGGSAVEAVKGIGQAAINFPGSVVRTANDIGNAALHPWDTLSGMGEMVIGGAQKLVPGEQGSEKNFDAVVNHFKTKYGTNEGLTEAIKNDPASVMMDISAVLTGGGSALARAPGIAGKIGAGVAEAGKAIEPFTVARKAVSAVPAVAGKAVPGFVKEALSPEGLYQSAMKFSNNPRVLSPLDRRRAVQTGLQEKMVPNEKSYNRLWTDVTKNKARVNSIIEHGEAAGGVVDTQEALRFLSPLEKRAAKIEKFSPEFAEVIREARAGIESYGDKIPVASAQALKETLQDLSKYGIDDRSRFAVAANKSIARGLRIQLETVYPELKTLNRNSSALLTLENELAKSVGRVGNRDLVGLGMKTALSGVADASKGAGILASIIDLPAIKSRLAIALYKAHTGKTLPPSAWKKAAEIVFSPEVRKSVYSAGVPSNVMQNQPPPPPRERPTPPPPELYPAYDNNNYIVRGQNGR